MSYPASGATGTEPTKEITDPGAAWRAWRQREHETSDLVSSPAGTTETSDLANSPTGMAPSERNERYCKQHGGQCVGQRSK
jgi:hypothetical protein